MHDTTPGPPSGKAAGGSGEHPRLQFQAPNLWFTFDASGCCIAAFGKVGCEPQVGAESALGRRFADWVGETECAAAAELERRLLSGSSETASMLVQVQQTRRPPITMHVRAQRVRLQQGYGFSVLARALDPYPEWAPEFAVHRASKAGSGGELAIRGSWYLDLETHQVTWSPEMVELFGIAQPSSIHGVVDCVHVEDRAAMARALEACAQTGTPYRSEYRVVLPDGSLRFVRSRGRRVVGEDGAAIAVVGTSQDMTPQRRVERRYRMLATLAPIGIFEANTEGTCVFVNERWCQITGLRSADALGASLMQVIHPEDRACFEADYKQSLREHRELRAQYRVLRSDGAVAWVDAVISISEDESGGVTCLGTFSDVTQNKEVQGSLHEALALTRGILESTSYGIVVTDRRGVIRVFNAGAEHMFGYTADEVVGKATPELFHLPSELEQRAKCLGERLGTTFAKPFDAMTASGAATLPEETEWTYVRKDGARRPMSVSLTALKDPAGRVSGHLGVCADISARKRAELELIRAKETAEAATYAKSEFLARMSHEIRTPMNGVLGMTDLLMQTRLTSEQRGYLQMVKSSAKGLLHVINDLLDFSRIEARKLELENIPFSLRDCLGEAVRNLALTAQRKGLELVLSLSRTVPNHLIGDRYRLQQIVTNLVSNALKFTSQGQIVVSARVQALNEREVTLWFSVSDTGIGIPEDKQAVVFEAFAQAEDATTRKFGGTGLGLAICSELVSMMSGRIWVTSAPGRGSEFQFTATFVRIEGAHADACDSYHGMSALVVDDNVASGEALADMLRELGFEVANAADDVQALSAVEALSVCDRQFAVVFVDEAMPSVDTHGLIRELQRRAREAKLIMMGVLLREPEHQRLLRLTKPLELAAVCELLRTALRGSKQPDSAIGPSNDAFSDPPLRVLVAEDNAVNQTLAKAILEKAGHSVHVVENGLMALESLACERFDVVLMDVQMPEMDGLEATRRLREWERVSTLHTPVIALTAQAMKGDADRCIAAGMDAYIAKPIDSDDLMRAVRASWAARRAGVWDPGSRSEQPPCRERDLFSRHKLLARLGGDEDLVREIIELSLLDVPRLMANLQQFVWQAESKQVEQTAHQLKGILLNLSAERASQVAAEVEECARANELSATAAKWSQLAVEIQELERHLRQERIT
ncbi:MAG TPA: PAS domain S-box protein [Polyangiaceae bacterium]|nr:PAS domain S-box protein [Polyangiaceae bacterium]